ncbi:hypothetical protein DDP54_15510 (plasmid) [Cellulomonas sp. WB94]|uniref:DUF2746 domain-containing protein n=1 Tax=Cellulomonas sp. WB94 TaxID=2173174 RepID=UPI000D5653CC|nr:DUF2746 domain-containing protein [Cellulomonas sp. WB94]PVU81309.1 hypothetical protein DDP54_15510 [Cellulomonas sp. WB94]
MSDDIIIAIIGALAAVTAALIAQGRALGRIRRDTSDVKWQVQNTHTTNLREDHDAMAANVDRVLKGQQALTRRFDKFATAAHEDSVRVNQRVTDLDDRLTDHIDQAGTA